MRFKDRKLYNAGKIKMDKNKRKTLLHHATIFTRTLVFTGLLAIFFKIDFFVFWQKFLCTLLRVVNKGVDVFSSVYSRLSYHERSNFLLRSKYVRASDVQRSYCDRSKITRNSLWCGTHIVWRIYGADGFCFVILLTKQSLSRKIMARCCGRCGNC